MFFMSSSIVICQNIILSKSPFSYCNDASRVSVQLSCGVRKYNGLVPNAKKRSEKKKTSWWQEFFFEEDGNWFGLKDEDLLDEVELDVSSTDDTLSEKDKFEVWKRRAESIVELREAQEDEKNEKERRWEDWIVDEGSWFENSNGNIKRLGNEEEQEQEDGFDELFSGRGLVKSVSSFVIGREDDEILYEDRVFSYASFNSAKFLAVLIIVPWALDFLVHDYVLMPFLDRYVKTVPLAAEILDVRKSQKLEIVKSLNLEKERYRLEVEIGKSPSLTDKELYLELRHKALELRDEWRLENRKAFANIWSDMVFGISLFVLLYSFESQVALLKFTGYKIVNNISDAGKAFLIILITDTFLGYHSESGWQTLLEVIVEHYGVEVDQSAIVIFVSLVPVIMDACVKLWMFKFLPRFSRNVASIFQEMQRH